MPVFYTAGDCTHHDCIHREMTEARLTDKKWISVSRNSSLYNPVTNASKTQRPAGLSELLLFSHTSSAIFLSC